MVYEVLSAAGSGSGRVYLILNERCTSDIDYVNNKGEKKILTY